jgi:hypothetical protein
VTHDKDVALDSRAAQNPYVVGKIVTGPGRFFGRTAELTRLRQNFVESETPSNLSIVGELRSGKSSLAQEFLRREGAELDRRFHVVLMDMTTDFTKGSIVDFYRQILQRAREVIAERGGALALVAGLDDAIAPRPWAQLSHMMQLAYRALFECGIRILYIFDEFDHSTELFPADQDAFKLARNLGQKDVVTFLTLSRRCVADIEMDAGISSNLAGIFDPCDVNMPLLDRDAAMALCVEPAASKGISWGRPLLERMLALSGRHPFLLQGMCHRLFPEAITQPEEDRIEVLERLAPEFVKALYQLTALRLEKAGLLDSLRAALSRGPQRIPREDFDRLTRLNYFVEGEGRTFVPFSPLLPTVVLGHGAPGDDGAESGAKTMDTSGKKRSKVFVGSSVEGLPIAEAIQVGLDYAVECTIWSQGVFELSRGALENLVRATKENDYAILVLTPDDVALKRNKTGHIPRDNVIFELGLFIGALGRERTYMVYDRDATFDLPSDLLGITPATFSRRDDKNLIAALGSVCTRLKTAMNA